MTTTTPLVVGDGTDLGSRSRRRWRKVRWALVVVAVAGLAVWLASLLVVRPDSTPLGSGNPGSNGGRALAQVLEGQGVDVKPTDTIARTVAASRPGATILITDGFDLTDTQYTRLIDTEADLVLLGTDAYAPGKLSGGALEPDYRPDLSPARRGAACDAPPAVAAQVVQVGRDLVTAKDEASTVCFPAPDDPRSGVVVVRTGSPLAAGRTLTVVSDASLFTNAHVTEDGNAALALWTLGGGDLLVWYTPTRELGDGSGPDAAGLLPPWVGPALAWLVVVGLMAALWRGRHLGPLVLEPLPVVVRADETARGRGGLYRRGRAYGHAAAALRAAAVDRMAPRLALPRTAEAPAVVEAVARGTGRSPQVVHDLLYGPAPAAPAHLMNLARELDRLENEVRP